MTAGFERHIESSASGAASRLSEGQNFRMRQARAQMKPPPDDPALFDNQSTDHRVRAGRTLAPRRQTKGHSHEMKISLHRFLREAVFDLREGLFDFAPAFFASASASAACAAASRAIATR